MFQSSAFVWTADWGDNGTTGSRGRRTVAGAIAIHDNEIGLFRLHGDMTRLVKKCQTDPDYDVLDIETTRTFNLYTLASSYKALDMWVTSRGYDRSIDDVVEGYPSGDGSGITVDVFDPDKKYIGSVVTTAGGNFSAPTYDGRDGHFAVARVDSTHVGRSDNVAPT
jgi:hypothetical protein